MEIWIKILISQKRNSILMKADQLFHDFHLNLRFTYLTRPDGGFVRFTAFVIEFMQLPSMYPYPNYGFLISDRIINLPIKLCSLA